MAFERLERCAGPACPKCGCEDAEILEEPKSPVPEGGSWWGSGRARCNNCRNVFHFKEIPPAPVVEYQEPVVEHQEPILDSPGPAEFVTVHKPICPGCGSKQVRVTHSLPAFRRYQCRDCKRRFKRLRDST